MLKTILKTLVMGWLAKRLAPKAYRPKGWKKAYRRGYDGYGSGYGAPPYGGYGHRPRGLKGLVVEALLRRLRR